VLSQSIASIFVAYALDGMDSWIVYLSIPAFSYDVSMENETLNSCMSNAVTIYVLVERELNIQGFDNQGHQMYIYALHLYVSVYS
jgi:hypothetical protein